MKILFVSSSPLEYSASSNMRNIALLNGFIENGHEVHTLTPMYQQESKLYDSTICNIDIKKKYYINMGKIRSKLTLKKGKKNIIKNIAYKVLSKFRLYDFRSSMAREKIDIKEKYDFIISSSDPKSSHLIAESLFVSNPGIAKKWIQYWGDPFASDINKKSYLPNFFIKKEEERLISKCDMAIYVSPFTCEKQKELYPKYANKMIFFPIPYLKKIEYPKTNNSKFVLGYYGDYRKKDRNIVPLYEVAKENKQNIHLNICGASDIELKCEDNITIMPRQNLSIVREYEKNTDALICICNRSGTQIPGKIYHYAATNKPILIILDGENKEKLKEYFCKMNRFIICYNNKEEIQKALLELQEKRNNFYPSEKLLSSNIAQEVTRKVETL